MEELNLYDDLDEFQEQQEKKSKELQELENKYQESLKTIEDLQAENKKLKKNIKTIELNFQSLLDTARAEIRRKNKEIDQLRKEKDDICFRRRVPHKVESHKRHLVADAELPENSTQTHRNKEINDPESKETFTPQGNQTHDDKAENISKPGRDESFKRNRSQERDQTNDNKRLKNIRDDKDYKSSHERHKDRYADAYKNSRQSDERNHNSHDRRKYESAERIHKTKSPERHRGAPNKSQSRSRERYRRDNSPEREKKTGHWESRESLERHRRPHNRSHSREAYKKHDKSELNKKIDHSNFSESSNSDKRQFYNSHNSERYNFENRDRKEVNKYTNSTLKGPIGPEVLNSVNDKLKQGNKADNEGETKGGISDTAQNVSNQIVTPENIDEETAKVCKDMTVDLTENDNLHSTNRGEKYEEQPFKHKKRNSDLKKIAISINSCVKGNKDDQNANTKQVQISSEEDKTNNSDDLTTTTSKQSGAKQSSNENPFDKPSESDKQQEPLLTVEASKLGTPCKVALFNEIFGQSSSTTTTSSSTKSLFNNIKGILANFTPNEGITTPTTSPGDCTEASDCIGTTKTKVCRDNVRENEMDKSLMPEESKSSDTTDKDLTKVMEEGIANEIHSVQIPGLDLCGESVITKHELKTTDTFNNESLTGLFTKQHLNDSEEQRIVQESKERESDMQNVSENSLQMPNKLNLKDAEQQKEANESKQMQSKAHLLLDNVLEVEDINRNVKQQISLQKSSKQSVKDKEEQNELKSHLVADNVTKENIQSYTKNHEQTSLDDISKNVKQTLPDNEQPKDKSMDIQIESNVRLVENKSPEFVKDKTPLEDTNKQNLKDKRKPKGESEDIHIERKSITNLEAVKDKTYLKDVDKSKQNNTLQEPTKQNQKVEEDYKRGNKSIQIETNCHLMHEFVKDKINVEVINQNTKCIDKEKLPKLETTSLIDSQNENVTENEQQIGKAQKAVESIEGEENTKQSGLLYTKSEFEKAVPQLNEIQVNISDNRNDDLIAANEYNTLTNSKVFPENSSKLMTTQENKVATIISPIAQDKINAAEIKNSDTMSKNESPNKDCLLEENKNENLCDKQQNSAKCTDLLTILDHETSISANISREITNNEYCKIQNRVEFTKSNDDEYSLENLESPELDRTEIANSIDISNPINCKSINTPLEIQNFSDEITRSSNASDKHKDTDNDSNRTQIQEAHISESASQDIKRNESLEILNRRESTRPAEEEYSFENQNFCNEITESANAGDKPNDKDTDSDKIQVQDVDLKDNESIEVLSAIEGSNKATGEQDPHENQNSFEEITSNAATSDKTNDANNDLFKSQVQETFIFESIPLVSEKTTSSASSENVSDKTEVRKADISGSALQEVENNESIDTNRAEIAKAEVLYGQYPVENQDFSEEIIKTVTISDEPNDTSNNSNETQSQKVPSQDIESNASIGTNRVEVAKPPDEQCPLETQDYSEEITKTAATSGEPN
ncbi:hypothetical protein DOY81_001272 [Sarcophaga bullata]|nr:hypothetical protein DOY81_001272 [Sarcophaga bullata]